VSGGELESRVAAVALLELWVQRPANCPRCVLGVGADDVLDTATGYQLRARLDQYALIHQLTKKAARHATSMSKAQRWHVAL
jgi:hypothetical protein